MDATIRDAVESDAETLGSIVDLPADALRNVVHDRTVRLAVEPASDPGPNADVESWLADALDTAVVADYDVSVLAASDWTNDLADADLAVACAECGNTVTDEGTSARLDGERYRFCCPTCEARFVERYEELADGIDGSDEP